MVTPLKSSVTLYKKKGSIVSQEPDFVVNASNTDLELGSGVSMALKRRCGLTLQLAMNKVRESVLNNKGSVEQGEVFATPAFDLKTVKYILHAAVINYNTGVKQRESKPTLETINTILQNCIPYLEWYKSEYKKSPLIVFPFLGCGASWLQKTNVEKVFDDFVANNKGLDADIILVGS
jgi:hypothetical protein